MNAKTVLPITLVATCLNESAVVPKWLKSLSMMSAVPSEIIIVDGGSIDETVDLLQCMSTQLSLDIKIIRTNCGISAGRNIGVSASRNELIAISDFGVVFDRDWLQELYNGLASSTWLAGHYILSGDNAVQRSYCRVLGDSRSRSFRRMSPSSRSLGFRKSAFLSVGGYPEHLRIGEDTEFNRLMTKQFGMPNIAESAFVVWSPRADLKSIFLQHYKYAYWDQFASSVSALRLLNAMLWIFTCTSVAAVGILFGIKAALITFVLWLLAWWVRGLVNTSRSGAISFGPLTTFVLATVSLAEAIGTAFGLLNNFFQKVAKVVAGKK